MPYTKKELEKLDFWQKILEQDRKEYDESVNRELAEYTSNPGNKPAELVKGSDGSAVLFESTNPDDVTRTGVEKLGQYQGIKEVVSIINLNEVDNIINREIEELSSNRKSSKLTITEFFNEYNRLRDEITPLGDFESHFYLVENSKLYLPGGNTNEIDTLKRALERETIEVMQIQSDLKEALAEIQRQQLELQKLQAELNQAIIDALSIDLAAALTGSFEPGDGTTPVHTTHTWTPDPSTKYEDEKFTQTCFVDPANPHTRDNISGTKKRDIIEPQDPYELYLAEIGELNKEIIGDRSKLIPFTESTWERKGKPTGRRATHAWSKLQFIENTKLADGKQSKYYRIEWDRNQWIFKDLDTNSFVTSFEINASAVGASAGSTTAEQLTFSWKLNGKDVHDIDGLSIKNEFVADTTDRGGAEEYRTASKVIRSIIQIDLDLRATAYWWQAIEGIYKCSVLDENGIAIDSPQYVSIGFDEILVDYERDELGPS